jgi:hypothetical protein
MKSANIIIGVLIIILMTHATAFAGTWSDGFAGNTLDQKWTGDRDNFSVADGYLQGRNAHPIQLIPPKWVEIGKDWDDYTITCKINVVLPNLLVCTKGALILRRSGNEGYVFALHVATKTVEVYRLSNEEMLLSVNKDLQLKKWYVVKAELQGDSMSFYLDNELIGKINDKRSASGTVGLAVQDVLTVLFDDFTITGPKIDDGSAEVKAINKIPITWAKLKYNH